MPFAPSQGPDHAPEADGDTPLLKGRSDEIEELRRVLRRVSRTEATVLLQGESGTGKECVAQTIHDLSDRRDGPFLAINCGALPATLISSELFGHERGSFTGAARQHRGYFERSSGGTLFLDEVTEMPAELQATLLRVLETGRLLRVGGYEELSPDVRIVAATNRPAREAMAEGHLRPDLYWRLAEFPVHVPPLRVREGDVPFLIGHFLGVLNAGEDQPKWITEGALARLHHHHWPGNVRELRNTLQRAFILADDVIDEDHLPDWERELEPADETALRVGIGTQLEVAERQLILATLDHYAGDKRRTAEALGVSLKTIYNRLRRYDAE